MLRLGRSAELPVAVSSEQKRKYQQLATAIVSHTVAELSVFTSSDRQRSVDPRRWKALKSHETVQIYRSRERPHTSPLIPRVKTPGSPARPLIEWEPMAQLLCVGTMLGTVDDAMYGAVTPTELAMATRSLYIQDEFTEHRVLHDIDVPTRDEPFRYLGLKWGARSSSISALVKPRDTLYLEATGCRDVDLLDGASERIGFVVYHSVELPEIPKADGMVRARVSACYIFRQVGLGIVELYGTMTSDAGGHLPTKLAALAGANVMIAASRVTECALKKKLAWMLSRRARALTDSDESHQRDAAVSCTQCSRSLSSFSSLTECAICCARVCSRCITSRRLLLGRTKATLRRKSVAMCKSCIATAKRGENAAEFAAAEFTSPRDARERLPSATLSARAGSHPSSHESHPLSSRSNGTTRSEHEEDITPVTQPLYQEPLKDFDSDSSDESDEIESNNYAIEKEPHTLPAEWGAQQTHQPKQETEWWMRINELRLQAEETFQLAKEQTITMQQASMSRVIPK